MGELHLEILVDRLMREFNAEATVGQARRSPTARRSRQAAHREARALREADGRSRGSSPKCVMDDGAQSRRGQGFEFVNLIKSVELDPATSTSRRCERGSAATAMEGGVLAGYPVVDIRVTLKDGSVSRGRLERDGLPGLRGSQAFAGWDAKKA